MTKVCKICKSLFNARGKASYCETCKYTLKVNCFQCGKDFVLGERYPLHVFGTDKKLFCSNTCTNLYKKQFAQQQMTQKEQSYRQKICRKCGAEYEGTIFSKHCSNCLLRECRVCLKKHSKENAFKGYCSEDCYKKSVQQATTKMKNTTLERYGAIGFANPSTKEKAQKSLISRFGVDNPFRLAYFQEKAKASTLKKYGKANYFSTQESKQKIKQTLLNKFGVENIAQSKENQQKKKVLLKERYSSQYLGDFTNRSLKKLSDQEILEQIDKLKSKLKNKPTPKELAQELPYANVSSVYQRIGEWRSLGVDVGSLLTLHESTLERAIEDFLKEYALEYVKHSRKVIPPFEVDFYLPKYKLAIEVNDFLTHNSTYSPFGKPKEKDYHFNKTKLCRDKGVRLIHAWEDYITDERKFPILKNAILNACHKNTRKVYARDTYVEVTPAIKLKDFFNENNISGYRGAKLAYTLKHKHTGETLMSYLVGDSLFGRGSGKKYEAEIIRGASLLGTTIVGGASKLWNYLIKHTEYTSIVYYVDLNLYCGNSLSFLQNTHLIREQPSFKNYFVEEGVLKNRNPAQHSLLKELTQKGAVWQVWDAGIQVWVWNKESTIT